MSEIDTEVKPVVKRRRGRPRKTEQVITSDITPQAILNQKIAKEHWERKHNPVVEEYYELVQNKKLLKVVITENGNKHRDYVGLKTQKPCLELIQKLKKQNKLRHAA